MSNPTSSFITLTVSYLPMESSVVGSVPSLIKSHWVVSVETNPSRGGVGDDVQYTGVVRE